MSFSKTLLASLVVLAACGSSAPKPATDPVVVVKNGVDPMAGWTRLGERQVDGLSDRDTIVVGGAEGRFRVVKILVENSALEMFDVIIHFGDGTTFSPPTRMIFDKDTSTRVLDLPGGNRVIQRVDFHYGNLPGGGKARVALWAR